MKGQIGKIGKFFSEITNRFSRKTKIKIKITVPANQKSVNHSENNNFHSLTFFENRIQLNVSKKYRCKTKEQFINRVKLLLLLNSFSKKHYFAQVIYTSQCIKKNIFILSIKKNKKYFCLLTSSSGMILIQVQRRYRKK